MKHLVECDFCLSDDYSNYSSTTLLGACQRAYNRVCCLMLKEDYTHSVSTPLTALIEQTRMQTPCSGMRRPKHQIGLVWKTFHTVRLKCDLCEYRERITLDVWPCLTGNYFRFDVQTLNSAYINPENFTWVALEQRISILMLHKCSPDQFRTLEGKITS